MSKVEVEGQKQYFVVISIYTFQRKTSAKTNVVGNEKYTGESDDVPLVQGKVNVIVK